MLLYKREGVSECSVSLSMLSVNSSKKCSLEVVKETETLTSGNRCQNCLDLYDLGGTFSLSDWQGYCAEKGFSIAPIPASAVTSWSKFNATMTYNTALPTKAGGASNTGAAATTTSSARRASITDGLSAATSRSSTRRDGMIPAGETITVSGDPTGTMDVQPLTTTTGIPPLQNVPLPQDGSSGARIVGGDSRVLRVASVVILQASLFFSAVFIL